MINRLNYPLREKFPPISDFPVYETDGAEVAVVSRLFLPVDQKKWRSWFNLALWSMRSHILNSDMQEYKTKYFFHVASSQLTYYDEPFKESGVPRDAILVYPDNIIKTVPGFALSYAASPFLDTRLDQFEYIIVMDADMLSLRSKSLEPFPLILMSLNDFPPDEIGLERSWVAEDDKEKCYKWLDCWYQNSPLDKSDWISHAAKYLSMTPEAFENLLYSADWGGWKGYAGHCGAYIRIPTSIYRQHPDLRSFIYEVSGDLGNEEMALGIWYIRHFLETGEFLPGTDFPTVCNERNNRVFWDSVRCRDSSDTPRQYHIFDYPNIDDYIYELSEQLGASDSERDELSETVISGVEKVKAEESGDASN